MSTRSLIGAEQQDGSVKFVYCHWDGYPNNNGNILRQHFTDRAKVEELIALGSISALGKEIGEKHDFDEPHEKHPDWCRFYGRDRGEKNVETQTAKSVLEFAKEDQGTEFWYLFTKDGKWMFCDGEKKLKRLTARACGVTLAALSQPVTVIDGGSRHRTRTKKSKSMSRSTRDELANILQTSYKSMIVEADEWRPMTDHVISLMELAQQGKLRIRYEQGSPYIEIIEDDDL